MLALGFERDRGQVEDVFESPQLGINIWQGSRHVLVQVGVAVDRHGAGHALVVEDFEPISP